MPTGPPLLMHLAPMNCPYFPPTALRSTKHHIPPTSPVTSFEPPASVPCSCSSAIASGEAARAAMNVAVTATLIAALAASPLAIAEEHEHGTEAGGSKEVTGEVGGMWCFVDLNAVGGK